MDFSFLTNPCISLLATIVFCRPKDKLRPLLQKRVSLKVFVVVMRKEGLLAGAHQSSFCYGTDYRFVMPTFHKFYGIHVVGVILKEGSVGIWYDNHKAL